VRTRSDEIMLWIATAVVFVPGVIALAQRWASAEYFQHGFLVPVVSLASAHRQIRGLGPSQRHQRALAGLVLALAGLCARRGRRPRSALQGLALVGAVASLVGYRWGVRGLRRLAFPIGFLLFMVPLPEAIVLPVVDEAAALRERGGGRRAARVRRDGAARRQRDATRRAAKRCSSPRRAAGSRRCSA
jgi:hypothetical protein